MAISTLRLALLSVLILFSADQPLWGQIPVLENGQPRRAGPEASPYPDSPTRLTIDLAGTWSVSDDGETWQDVRIPASIDAAGRYTFRRTFSVSEEQLAQHAFKLTALGIAQDAEVYINDIYLGRHIGGSTGLEFDIPDNVLQSGPENSIQVVVVNRLGARTTVPVRMQSWGWRTYGGILRDIFVVGTPRLWVDQLAPRTSYNEATSTGEVLVQAVVTSRSFAGLQRDSAAVRGRELTYLYAVEVLDPVTSAVVAQSQPQILTLEPNKDLEVQTTVAVPGARVWRPDQPDWYRLRAIVFTQEGKQRTVIDECGRMIGFPAVRIANGQLLENGARLRLRGVVWHEDAPDHGASLTYEQMEKDLALIKSLGANAVRFAFHPPHPYILQLCARYGLYALVEAPVWNVPSSIVGGESFRTLVEPVVRDMVEQNRSNPAILAWGLGDGLDGTDERVAAYVRDMRALVRSLDARPVYAGTVPMGPDIAGASLDLDAVDVTAPDLRQFREVLQNVRAGAKGRPVLVLSYGVQVEHTNRNGYRDSRSQEAQARYYLQHSAAIKDLGLSGGFVAALADWRGDRPVLGIPSGDRTLHPLGLMSASREKRLAFDVVRAQYQEEKFPAIPAGSSRSSFPAAHVLTGLFVIILFGYEYSYNRRFGESVKRALLRSYNFFADVRDRRDVPAFATLVLAFCLSVTMAVITSSVLYHYRSSPTADALLNVVVTADAVKAQIIEATWNPVRGIAVFTVLIIAILGVHAGLVRVLAFLGRVRITYEKAWLLTVWGALPLIVLSPLGMSMFKIMETPAFVVPAVGIVVAVVAWSCIRVLKAVSVIFDISAVRAYSLALLVGAIIIAGTFFYMDNSYALRANIEHVVRVISIAG